MTNKKLIASGIILVWLCLILFSCNHGRPCIRPSFDLSNEPYGATDISAITGNRGLSVGINEEGTITVFKWPNPSFYDHVKFMTTGREKERLGALENEGVFAGIHFRAGDEEGFFWLRDARHEQRYSSDTSVAVITLFRESRVGLEVEQTDFVTPHRDLMWRHYRIKKLPGSNVEKVRLLWYANFSPQVSKLAFWPIRDWCMDGVGNSTLRWRESEDLFVQFKNGRDRSTGKDSSVYLAFGFEGESSGHHAGPDGSCSLKRGLRRKKDAFFPAGKGELPNSDYARGKVTAAILREHEFNNRDVADVSVLISAAGSEEEAVRLVESGRKTGYAGAFSAVEESWEKKLAKVPVPATDDARIREVALRSFIVLLLGYSRDTGAGVASISTQPPYGLDWPRDGVYMNHALMVAGLPELVRARNLFYARVQSRPGNEIKHVPSGNWATNYYADGVPGFPYIWWEIDETGWALWSMVSYYEATRDRPYLEEVYPAIRLAADFLVDFRDKNTGLHKKSFEDDNPFNRQTLHGAVPIHLGLKSAAIAAREMNDPKREEKWKSRADELERAIFENFYDPACKRFVHSPKAKGNCNTDVPVGKDAGLLLWPGELLDNSDPRADEAARQVWDSIEKSFSGKRDRGMYEPYGLLILAKYWKDRPDKLELVKDGLAWQSMVPISATGHFGEVWITIDGKVVPGEAQPHLWHHALFYLAAIEAFGIERN